MKNLNKICKVNYLFNIVLGQGFMGNNINNDNNNMRVFI